MIFLLRNNLSFFLCVSSFAVSKAFGKNYNWKSFIISLKMKVSLRRFKLITILIIAYIEDSYYYYYFALFIFSLVLIHWLKYIYSIEHKKEGRIKKNIFKICVASLFFFIMKNISLYKIFYFFLFIHSISYFFSF